jgi:ABC-type polysaccharide/polyol phosphate export permease
VDGVLPALLVMLAFVPFIWGLGLLGAAAMLTFRRGGGAVMIGATILGLLSGAYFPLDLLPGWLEAVASVNPVAIAIDSVRQALLSGDGWARAPRACRSAAPRYAHTARLAPDRNRLDGAAGLSATAHF